MSYIPKLLRRFDTTGSAGYVNNTTYTNLDDTLATMQASGYIDPTVNTDQNIAGQLKVSDLIYLVGSDGADLVKIATLDPITVTTNVEAISLADGSIFIGNASNEAAAVAASTYDVITAKENNGGGSATIAITATGTLATDFVFAQVQASTVSVSVLKVTPTADTVTVLLSADPGAATVITYVVKRATT